MKPIRYAYPPGPSHSAGRAASALSLNGKMSLCQSWFGVLRSKKRGLDGFFGGFFFGGLINLA